MKINIFVPPKFEKKTLDIENLNKITDKRWIYTSTGRSSIYHILKDLNFDKILIPAYICSTVLIPLKKLNIEPIFYDLDIEDLNPSLESIKKLAKKYDVKVVLVASMYGNPADLLEMEKYCKENSIFMIDDSAQSFGAILNSRYVGTFGDAGFFSFSPGKPTAGHMGSFFWSKDEVKIDRRQHFLTHYFRWLDVDLNRYKIYDNKNRLFKKIVNFISRVLLKLINIDNDKISVFEKDIIGGILYENINGMFIFRSLYNKKFIEEFKNNRYFRIIENIRGKANNHKFVIIFDKKEIAKEFIKYMFDNDIYVLNGYELLTNDLSHLPNAKFIDKKIVELPIEDNEKSMKYLFEKVREFEI